MEADIAAMESHVSKCSGCNLTASLAAAAKNDGGNEAPGHFIFYEIFANQADFDANNAMPYVKAWFAKLPALAEGGLKVMRMEILDGPRE